MDRRRCCCFTGHRDSKLPWGGKESDSRCVALKKEIYRALEIAYAGGCRHFICGMATGCDMYFCEAVLELRQYHQEITLEAAVPFEGQADKWAEALRRRYERLLAECDYLTVVQQQYSSDCYMRRNRYMVDSSAVIIAAYNGRPGGTMNTLLYAMREGLQVLQLAID